MEKETLDFKRGLSIQELEDRHELTIALTIAAIADSVEVGKDDDNTGPCGHKCQENCDD